jgi:uncharacterized RDD family membrane protein YckC
MSWYYADSGRQTGPIDDASLDALIRQGSIRGDTLVWKEGMSNWQPLSTVRPMAAPQPPAPVAPTPQPQASYNTPSYSAPAPQASGQTVACANCGQWFAMSEVVFLGSSYVCAACKPIFLQRMREGSAGGAVGARRYAGFWIRFGAALIDGIIVGIAGTIITAPLMFASVRATDDPMAAVGMAGITSLIRLALYAAYSGYFLSTKAATPGKLMLGLKVIRSDGSTPITFVRGACRYLAQIISALILMIGYIIAAFDAEKRALHDHLCDTRVVYK